MTDWRNLADSYPVSASVEDPAPLPEYFHSSFYLNAIMDRSTTMNSWQYIHSFKQGEMNSCAWMFYTIPDDPLTAAWGAFCQRMHADFGLDHETDRTQDWWAKYIEEHPGPSVPRPRLDLYRIDQALTEARRIVVGAMNEGRYCTQEELDAIEALVGDRRPDNYAAMALNTERWRRALADRAYSREHSDFTEVESQTDMSFMNTLPEDIYLVEGNTYEFSASDRSNYYAVKDNVYAFDFWEDEEMTTKMTTDVVFSGAERVGLYGATFVITPTSATPRLFYYGIGHGVANKVYTVSSYAELPSDTPCD